MGIQVLVLTTILHLTTKGMKMAVMIAVVNMIHSIVLVMILEAVATAAVAIGRSKS